MMAQTVAIWRQPVAERRAAGSLWLTWFLLALCLLGATSAAIDSPKARFLFAFLTTVPMGMLLIMWWHYLCANVKTQCHPAALQLVPALRHRTMRAVVLAWLAIVAIITLLAGVPTGYPLQVAIITALVLIETSFAGAWRSVALWIAFMVLPQVLPTLGGWLGGFLATPAGLAAGVLLVLVDGAAALRRLGRVRAAPGAGSSLLAAFKTGPRTPRGRAVAWLDQAIAPQPAFLRPLGRSWFSMHWSTILSLAVACAAIRAWVAWQGHAADSFLVAQRTLWAVAMPCLLALVAYREARRFATGRTEQALLCLTPCAPGGDALNSVLARLLLRGFATYWLVLGAFMLATLTVLDASAAGLARMCAVWLATLPLVAVPMRNFAQAGGAPGLAATPLMTLLIWAASTGVNGVGAPTLWLALAGGGIVGGFALARWRWQVMLAAAPALPAGRVQDKRRVR